MKKIKINQLPLTTQAIWGDKIKTFMSNQMVQQPLSILKYLIDNKFNDQNLYESMIENPELMPFINAFNDIFTAYPQLVTWHKNISAPPAE
jgi:hypothetical protein